jgi:hypothetical protein
MKTVYKIVLIVLVLSTLLFGVGLTRSYGGSSSPSKNQIFTKVMSGSGLIHYKTADKILSVDVWTLNESIGIVGIQLMICSDWNDDLTVPTSSSLRLVSCISLAPDFKLDGELLEAYLGFHANTDSGDVRPPFTTPNNYESEILMFPSEYSVHVGAGENVYLHLTYDSMLNATVTAYGYAHIYYVKYLGDLF